MKNINVILVFNPLTKIYIKQLISKIDNKEEILIIEFYKKKIIDDIEGIKIIRLQCENSYKYLINLYKYKTIINKLDRIYNKIKFYFAHPNHIISNYVFFRNNNNYEYNLIPDGILNYYNITTNKLHSKMNKKRKISRMLGLDYTIYEGHLTGYEFNKYKNIYCLHKEDLITYITSDNLIKLNINLNSQHKSENILILGQTHNNSKKYLKLLENCIIFYLNKIHFKESCEKGNVYYKPHPNEFLDENIKELLNKFNIKIYLENTPAELLISKFNTFIGFTSSVLMNLRIIYGNQYNIYSYIDYKYITDLHSISKENLDEIVAVFINKGINVYEHKL